MNKNENVIKNSINEGADFRKNITIKKKGKDSEDILVNSIRESVFGPEYFAEQYWKYIEEGGNPDVF